jgi:hypothetical protein
LRRRSLLQKIFYQLSQKKPVLKSDKQPQQHDSIVDA